MTKIVEQILSLAQKATRAEQYAALNVILALLEEQDSQLSPEQVAELDRRDILLKEGKMSFYTSEETIEKIRVKLGKAS